MKLQELLILFEIFFPLIGITAIVVLVGMKKGREKWLVLIFGPLILMIVYTFLLKLQWIDGNLLTMASYGIMLMATYYYYIVLAIIGAVKGWKTWREKLKLK